MAGFDFDPHPILGLDRALHEPVRLALVACLAETGEADFPVLQKALGLTGGNLCCHGRKLEAAGYVETIKEVKPGARSRTTLRLTPTGRRAFTAYTEAMRSFLERIEGQPIAPPPVTEAVSSEEEIVLL